MIKCNERLSMYCQNACCYIKDKEITDQEATLLAPEGAVKWDDGKFRLRNNPVTGACVYLNIEEGHCNLVKRSPSLWPSLCSDYSCTTSEEEIKRINRKVNLINNNDDYKSVRMVTDMLVEARDQFPGLSDEEALMVMYPDIV